MIIEETNLQPYLLFLQSSFLIERYTHHEAISSILIGPKSRSLASPMPQPSFAFFLLKLNPKRIDYPLPWISGLYIIT